MNAITFGTARHIQGEINLVSPERKCFAVNVRPVMDKKNEILGRVISFNDVTGYVHLLKELQKLKNLINDFQSSGVKIEYTRYGTDSFEDPSYAQTIYRVCQEALTNSVRHGKAKHIDIILRFTGICTKLFIIDDGCGCKNIKKGFGLSGMEQRIKSAKRGYILRFRR